MRPSILMPRFYLIERMETAFMRLYYDCEWFAAAYFKYTENIYDKKNALNFWDFLDCGELFHPFLTLCDCILERENRIWIIL